MRGTYRTDNRRRGRIAAILLLGGVPLTAFAVASWIFLDEASKKSPPTGGDPLVFPSILLGLGIGMLIMGGWIGVLALNRRGEVFELHDNGLRYSRVGRFERVTWRDVECLVIRDGKDNAFARWAGGDVSCTVVLTEGRRLAITGLTENAAQLVRHIDAAMQSRTDPDG
ncbi:hypothetical protein [Actinomadura terrae]|uniref:hypothetical protein n=1 Tax=Actinomadura terrae TaxID=604353 RepID=UPI001FA6B778|nr:hypothetical protein [Actinomadura terrae]